MNQLNKFFITISLFIALFNSVNYNADIDTLQPSMFNQVALYLDPLEASRYNQVAIYIDPLEASSNNQIAVYNDPLKPSLYNQLTIYSDPLMPNMMNQVVVYKEDAPLYIPFVIDTGVVVSPLDECSINDGPLINSSYAISLLVIIIFCRIIYKYIINHISSSSSTYKFEGLINTSRTKQRRDQRFKKRFNSRYSNNR